MGRARRFRPYEPWHWEYVTGTVEMGSDWGR